MHARILVIAPRDCLRSFHRDIHDVNVGESIGENTGNSIFWFSIQKLLLADGVESNVMSLQQCAEDVDRVNREYAAAVMCPANALNYDFRENLLFMTEVFARFRIPVFVIGLGAQSSYDYDMSFLGSIGNEVRRFVSSILGTGGAIGCRGHFTGDVLKKLGFHAGSDYEVLGCPSIFIFGPGLKVCKSVLGQVPLLPAFNGVEMVERRNLRKLLHRYPSSIFVSQDKAYPFLFDPGAVDIVTTSLLGNSLDAYEYLIDGRRLKMFFDFIPWREALIESRVNFMVGTRIHGSIAAILSGIPAYIWAKDSRVREMADFFHIPNGQLPSKLAPAPDLNRLYDRADYGRFNEALPEKFMAFKTFMNGRGLPWGEDFKYIEKRLSSEKFNEPYEVAQSRQKEVIEEVRRVLMGKRHSRRIGNVRKFLCRSVSIFILNRQKRKEFRRRHFGVSR